MTNNKDRLKILPLSNTLKLDSKWNRKDYKSAPITFRKENLYLTLHSCWFETFSKSEGWLAFDYDREVFLQDLYFIQVWYGYNQKQINALKECRKERVSTEKQNHIIWVWDLAIECKEVKRRVSRFKVFSGRKRVESSYKKFSKQYK